MAHKLSQIGFMLDCIKKSFKEYVTNIHKKEYSQCNLSQWTMNESMNNGRTKLFSTKTCNLKSIFRQSSLNMKFFDKASKYELSSCKGK